MVDYEKGKGVRGVGWEVGWWFGGICFLGWRSGSRLGAYGERDLERSSHVAFGRVWQSGGQRRKL